MQEFVAAVVSCRSALPDSPCAESLPILPVLKHLISPHFLPNFQRQCRQMLECTHDTGRIAVEHRESKCTR